MSVKAVLFDLDGTLLPMDQDEFVNTYFARLVEKAKPYGYKADELIAAIWSGTKQMVLNDGSRTNEEVFWEKFATIFGAEAVKDKPVFDDFYANEFSVAQKVCGYNPKANEAVQTAKKKGFRTVLATNPIFPRIATVRRSGWAGINLDDFELFTTYENSHYSKPNPDYYKELLNQIDLKAEECLMVGNDVSEDMIAETLGMKVFLLTDCIINKKNEDITKYPHGGFDELIQYISKL